ncbi:hypothetical protein H9P43_008556 [Blastocladiella emersonii ATCC 22665]|nr:hypothetical protein H9P43_008556 [Blastocladiella emersonii ATCC 22665]
MIHTPKYHCLSEYVEFIKRFGPTTILSTEATERLHNDPAEYEGMDEVFNNLAELRLSTLKATTFDLSNFGPGREEHFSFGTTASLSVDQLSTRTPFLAQILHGYLAEDAGLSAQRAADDPLMRPDDGKLFMSKAISFEDFSLGGFRNEELTGKWPYLTSGKKYRVGRLAAALHFTHNGTEHDVAIKNIPVQVLALHPAVPGMGLGRYHAVDVAAFQTFVHVVPNYDRPAAPTRSGAGNALLESEYREWLLNPFDCAGSAALMA